MRNENNEVISNVLNNITDLTMMITIKNSNPYLMYRIHNYFHNKGVQCMLCNDDTEVSLFSLDRDQVELLLAAFTKHFHLKPSTTLAMAS